MMSKKNQAKQSVNDEAVQQDISEQAKKNQKITQDEIIATLELENKQLAEKAARAVADYQNLERRQREEQAQIVSFAQEQVFGSLLQPLHHLSLAAENLKNQGLDMVVAQFWQVLAEQGLEEIKPVGEVFDAAVMEAVAKEGEGETVLAVVTPGYKLHGRVLQPAKVKVG